MAKGLTGFILGSGLVGSIWLGIAVSSDYFLVTVVVSIICFLCIIDFLINKWDN